MLLAIRDKAQGWIAWVIVGFISIPFALWGIQEYLGVSGPQVVAKVGGEKITQQQLETNVERFRQQLRQLFDGPLPDFFSDQALRAQVLDSMIDDRVIVLHANKVGVRAGDLLVRDAIANYPAFQRDGRFDSDVYSMTLQRQGMSPAGFESQTRQQLSVDLLQSTIMQTDFVAPNELAIYLALKNQQRTLSYVRLQQSTLAPITIEAAALRAAYDANPERFRESEQVRLDYLELSLADLADRVEITQSDIVAEYERNRAAYGQEEIRAMRHILFAFDSDTNDADLLQQALGVREELQSGADFAALARDYSDDPGSAILGGDLGLVTRGIMVEAFEAAAFALAVGEVSEPVLTRFGYHLIEVTAIEGGEVQPLVEVEQRIRQELQMEQAERLFYDRAEQLANLTFDAPDSLEPAAQALGLTVQTTDWLTRDADHELLATPRIATAAFSDEVLRQRFNSDPLERDSDTLVVIRVNDYREANVLPFETVAPQIREELASQARQAQLEEQALALQQQLQTGMSLPTLAQSQGLELIEASNITRDDADLPSEVLAAAFAVAPRSTSDTGASAITPLLDGDYAVLVVTAVQNADAAALPPSTRATARQTLTQQRGEQALEQYVTVLRAATKVDISLR